MTVNANIQSVCQSALNVGSLAHTIILIITLNKIKKLKHQDQYLHTYTKQTFSTAMESRYPTSLFLKYTH